MHERAPSVLPPRPRNRFHPHLTPDQADTIIAASDGFGLWARCKRTSCHRLGACAGFAGPRMPPCGLLLVTCCGVCVDAILALEPGRAPRAPDEFVRRLTEAKMRMVGVLEQTLDQLEREAKGQRE